MFAATAAYRRSRMSNAQTLTSTVLRIVVESAI